MEWGMGDGLRWYSIKGKKKRRTLMTDCLRFFRCGFCAIPCWCWVFREKDDWCDGGLREVRVKLKREK